MKNFLILFCLFASYKVKCQDSSYIIKKDIPIKVISNQKDTVVSSGRFRIVHETKKDMQAVLADSTYLNKIIGIYLIGNSGPEIKIERKNAVLSITLPGRLETELIPITSSLFKLKDDPSTMMFLYFDQKHNVPAINIQNSKENYGANRKGYHFD
ncbi:hypothetical protein GCM10027592_39700 [Spirosoma flavus]